MIIRKIPKYHSGDHIVDYFLTYEPLSKKSSGTTKTTKKAASSEYSNKDLLKAVGSLDGMPSDVDAINDMVTEFFESGVATSGDSSLISMYYTDILSACRKARFSNEEYGRAYEAAKSKEAINELAINDLGQMICVNKETGDFKYMKPEELSEAEGYVPLTNSQLLYSRAHDTSLAFSNQPLSIIENSVSINTVTSFIDSVLSNLGNNERKGPLGFDMDDEVVSAINTYLGAVKERGGEGAEEIALQELYNSNLITKTQTSQIANAFNYIYSTLPENMRTLLKMKSDGTEDGAKKLIMTLLAAKVDSTIQIDTPTLKSGATGGSRGSSENISDYNVTLPYLAIRGIGGEVVQFKFEYPDSDNKQANVAITVNGREYPVSFNDSKQSIGTLHQMLQETAFDGAIDPSKKISFGGVEIPGNKLDKFVWKSNSEFMCAILPCNDDGSVNLKLEQLYKDFYDEVGGIDMLAPELTNEQKQKINDVLKEPRYKDLKDLYNSDGTPNRDKFCRYMITTVETSNESLDMPYSDFVGKGKYVKDCTKKKKKKREITNDLEAVLTDQRGRPIDLDMFNTWGLVNDLWGRDYHDNVFIGVIYIPMRKEFETQVIYGNEKLKREQAMRGEQEMQNILNPIRSVDPSVLNN